MSTQKLWLKKKTKLLNLLEAFYSKINIDRNKETIFDPEEFDNIHILNKKFLHFDINIDREFKFILKPEINSDNKIVIPKNTYYMLRKHIRPVWDFGFVYYYIDHIIKTNIQKLSI